MIAEYVLFDVPKTMTRAEVVAGMRAVAPKSRAMPDLIRKTFVYDPDNGQTGAVYLWQNKAAAVRAHEAAWREGVPKTFGSAPVISYFQTPLVVDNALRQTIEAVSVP